ncbi:SBE2, partial [[Candida] subhashii]
MSTNITTANNEDLYDISISNTGASTNRPSTASHKYNNNNNNHHQLSSSSSVSTNSSSSSSQETSPKRPGDYYVQKLSSSTINLHKQLPPCPPSHSSTEIRRKPSGDSLGGSSYPSSIISDESSSIIFESNAESRLSTMTAATSIIPEVSQSTSSIISEDHPLFNKQKFANNHPVYKLRASSTSSVIGHNKLQHHPHTQYPPNPNHPPMKSSRSKSFASIPTLHRTKTRYLNSQETKERQILRKKRYEEFDQDDDEILSNGIDNLIFNVPIIKNHSDLYLHSSSASTTSSSSLSTRVTTPTMLSRRDLIKDGDNNKYNISTVTVKPCPLPGRLNSGGSIPTSPLDTHMPTVEEDETTVIAADDDSEIAHNLSEFYTERSESISKLIKLSREQTLMYKLPTFVKSQSSIEDLHLISCEKLNVLDQTRPIHLPPKNLYDKTKHHREINKVLSDYELNTKNLNDTRAKSIQSQLLNRNQWIKSIEEMMSLDGKAFNKRFNSDKNIIRKLSWESNIPNHLQFQFFMKILS